MGILNWLTGEFGDDYILAFTFDADFQDLGKPIGDIGEILNFNKPIKGIGDVFHSQYYHYLTQHGRVITEGIIQYFMSLRNKHVFDVLNSLMFVAYLCLLQLHSGRFTLFGTAFVAAMTFIFVRAFGEVFLWMSGSINYLWVACLNLALIYIFGKERNDDNRFASVCYAMVAFLIGSMQEGFSIGISAAMMLYILYRWKFQRILSAVPVCIMVGYLVGLLFDLLSPGIWIRARESGIDWDYNVRILLDGIVYVLKGLRVFWILAVVIFVQSIRRQIDLRNLLRRNSLFLSAMFFQALFLMILGRTAEPRSLFAIEMFAMIVLLQFVPVQSVHLGIFSALAFIMIYLFAFHLNWRNYQTTQEFLRELDASEDGMVFFDVPHYTRSEVHYLGSRIMMDHRRSLFTAIATYYGKKDGIVVLPRRFREELYLTSSFIQPENYYRDQEYSYDDIAFSVRPLSNGTHVPLSFSDSLGGRVEFVSFPSGNYLLRDKHTSGHNRRIKRKVIKR